MSFRPLDRDDADDRAALARLIDACDDDDLEEAELDLDDLDPHLLAMVDADGEIVAESGARPSEVDDRLDDIAVLTHPDHRGRRWGALTVHEFITRRQVDGARFLYRCDVENHGSNRVAESVGFEMIHQIAAVRFPDDL